MFNLQNTTLSQRLQQLSVSERERLTNLTEKWLPLFSNQSDTTGSILIEFLLPLIRFGLADGQIDYLLHKLPTNYPPNHREIYFDFRLDRWLRHVEPPSLRECIQDFLQNAPSQAEGIEYVQNTLKDVSQDFV
jgi:hypothetical protein